MKPSKPRKRKTDDIEESNSSSKIGKAAKSAPGNKQTNITSKYFEAESSKKAKVQLKRAGTNKAGSQTSVPGSSRSESNAEVADGPKTGSKLKRTETSDIAHGDKDLSKENPDDRAKAGDTTSEAHTASKLVTKQRLDFKFYDLSCEDLAKALLGQVIVTVYEGKRLAGRIVETEAYLGLVDKAAHSYKGKTDRNTAMFMKPGTAYVYNIYGMYCCLNISAQGDGCAVLIRALQPVENLEEMDKLRKKGKGGNSLLKKNGKDLCNGPSKLCQALAIKKDTINKVDLCTSSNIWLEKGEIVDDSKIIKCKRININYAEEWVDKPLRFYILGNEFNSVRDKNAEKEFNA